MIYLFTSCVMYGLGDCLITVVAFKKSCLTAVAFKNAVYALLKYSSIVGGQKLKNLDVLLPHKHVKGF